MITLENLITAINLKIRTLETEAFEVVINENDVKEGFKRPSFFSKIEETRTTHYLHDFMREVTISIYYFPSDRDKYQLEVMEMQQKMEKLFKNGLEVGDRHINIEDDIEGDVSDGVLSITMKFKYYDVDESESEMLTPMEELIFDEQ